MKKILERLLPVVLLLAVFSLAVSAQTTGAIVGTVSDANGAVVPNATVVINSPYAES